MDRKQNTISAMELLGLSQKDIDDIRNGIPTNGGRPSLRRNDPVSRTTYSIEDARKTLAVLTAKSGGQGDETRWLNDAAETALQSAALGQVGMFGKAKGLFRNGADVVIREGQLLKELPGAVKKIPGTVSRKFTQLSADRAAKSASVAERALAIAREQPLERFGNVGSYGGRLAAEKAKKATVRQLEDMAASRSQRLSDLTGKLDAKKAAAVEVKPTKPVASPGHSAKDFIRQAAREADGGDGASGIVRNWIANNRGKAGTVGWGIISAQVGAAAAGAVKAFNALTSGAEQEATDRVVADAQQKIDENWNSVTNSSDLAKAFSDGAAVRHMLRRADAAFGEQIRVFGSSEEQVKRANDVFSGVVNSLRGTDGWNAALSEAQDNRDEWIRQRVSQMPLGDFNGQKAAAEAEYDSLPEDQKIMTVR